MSPNMESTAETPNRFDPALMEILRCPVTRSRLRKEGDWLIAESGGIAYPIKDGIPVMLAESARLPSGIDTLEQFKERFGAPATD